MADDRRRNEPHVDPDGVRITGSTGLGGMGWRVLLVLGIVGACGVVVRFLLERGDGVERPAERVAVRAPEERRPAPPPVAVAAPAPVASPVAEHPAPRRHEAAGKPDPDPEPTFTLNAPGEHAGIAAFPPPGTKPVKRGIIVPDGFELPEGYVRHYQTTDDGRQLPPILMFHPDYAPVDAAGNPIALPEDRVVPPDMAPAGMPVQAMDPAEQPGKVGRAR